MAFNGTSAGSKVGLEIWRIENLQPVPIDPATYGSFHTGDCYIVLNTYTKNPRSAKLDADLHFWLGDHSSQDERGAAAYRTVELDDFLNGVPIQHREVQGHESPKFLSYFPNGIQYLDGGVDSAFRHVDSDSYSPRLFHIKGKRNVRCVQVEFSAKSLNEGDCFLLDNGLTIYQWNGAESNRLEKFKALEVGTKIKDKERGGKAKLIFLESRDKNSDSEEFFRLLGGSHADVKSSADGGDDDSIRDDIASLWRVSDSTGKLEMTEVARGKLEKSMLDDNDVFILDGGSEVFVWIGKGASKDERKNAMTYGSEYLLTHNKPSWTPLTRLPSGGETIQFKSKFRQFDVEYIQKEETYVAKERKIEMGVLMEKQKRAEEKMIDQGNGKVTVWKIENLKKVPVEPKSYGQFNSGDSYIVLYQYRLGNRDAYLLYMWQGRDSKTDEKAATALLTVEAAQELGDIQGAQVRVAQNKEPSHFLAIFKSKMVVYSSEGNSSQSNFGSDSRLFHIRGTNGIDTRAVEVAPTATSLNSADCFVLQTKSNAFIWQGSGSNSDERSIAETLTTNILADGRTVVGVMEGNESDEFWSALGGKSDYANAKHLQSQVSEPRLFHVSGLTGNFKVEELFNFAQDDLSQDNVFLLDTVAEVYVWVGANARSADKDAAMSMAMQYVSNAPDGRSSGTPVFKITAGAEPPTFTAQFLGWSFEKAADFSDPYQRKLEQLKAESQTSNTNPSSAAATLKPTGVSFSSPSAVAAVAPAPVSPPVSTSSSSSSGVKIYSLAELKSSLPPGVDPTKKQDHLSNQEFESAFGQTRESFAKLAGWRQADLKKKVGIF